MVHFIRLPSLTSPGAAPSILTMVAKRWLSCAFLGGVLMQASQAQTAPASFRDEYASVNGVRLHYVSAGNGPLILFLHGFPEFWYEWRNQLAEFGKDHLAVAPDMRGYNLSDKPEALDQYLMPVLVEDVRALADRLAQGRKFVLVAHDWGGAVAWAFAIAHPEMLEKLVIINAPHPGVFGKLLASDPAQQKASTYMLMFRGGQAEQTLRPGAIGRWRRWVRACHSRRKKSALGVASPVAESGRLPAIGPPRASRCGPVSGIRVSQQEGCLRCCGADL